MSFGVCWIAGNGRRELGDFRVEIAFDLIFRSARHHHPSSVLSNNRCGEIAISWPAIPLESFLDGAAGRLLVWHHPSRTL
jgi:hypothetical protein